MSSASKAPLTFQAFEASVSDAWDICDVDVGGQSQAAAATGLGVIDVQPGGRRSLSSNQTPPKPPETKDHAPVTSSSVPTSTSITKTATEQNNSVGSARFPEKNRQTECKKSQKIEALLQSPSFQLEDLRKLAWPGIPAGARPRAWKTLCGYLPPPQDTSAPRRHRQEVVQRKRDEYARYVQQYFATRDEDVHGDTYRQIHIDIPRMSPVVGLFQQRCVQEIFERILYIWAIRHPASGYVQGINDLVTPFFLVFLHDALTDLHDGQTPFDAVLSDNLNVENVVPLEERDVIEADSFWCLTKILDGIQGQLHFRSARNPIKG